MRARCGIPRTATRLVLATCAVGLSAAAFTGQAMAQLGLPAPVGAGDESQQPATAVVGADSQLSAPVGAVAETVAEVTDPVATAASDELSDTAAETAQAVATPAIATVTEATRPATSAVEPLAPLTSAVTEFAQPVAEVAEPLLEPVVAAASSSLEATVQPLVTGPLPTAETTATTSPSPRSVGHAPPPAVDSEPVTPKPQPSDWNAVATASSSRVAPASPPDRRASRARASTYVGPLDGGGPYVAEQTSRYERHAAAGSPARAPQLPERVPMHGGAGAGQGPVGSFLLLLAALAAGVLLAAPGLGRRLRLALAPRPLPIPHLSLERPG